MLDVRTIILSQALTNYLSLLVLLLLRRQNRRRLAGLDLYRVAPTCAGGRAKSA